MQLQGRPIAMTDAVFDPTEPPPTWLRWFLSVALAGNIFAIVAVNYWIYHARAVFIDRHPDYVAVQPPTISRAIADPLVGEPFAVWITTCGILLVAGVLALGVLYLRHSRVVPPAERRLRIILRAYVCGIMLGQTVAAVGMYLLSNFRFPTGNENHMLGSIIFFSSQALVVLLGTGACGLLLRHWDAFGPLESAGLLRRKSLLFRRYFGFFIVGLVLFYLALFKAKGIDLSSANALVYTTYTMVEPVVISAFLLFLALFQIDLARGTGWLRVRPGGAVANRT